MGQFLPVVDDPIPPLQRLEDRFREAVEAEGGRLLHFSVSPGTREVQILAELDEDLFLDDDAREMKEAIEMIERGNRLIEKDEKVVKVVKDLSALAQQLEDPDEGIL